MSNIKDELRKESLVQILTGVNKHGIDMLYRVTDLQPVGNSYDQVYFAVNTVNGLVKLECTKSCNDTYSVKCTICTTVGGTFDCGKFTRSEFTDALSILETELNK